MPAEASDFSVSITPADVAVSDMGKWLSMTQGTGAATEFLTKQRNLDDAGVVRANGQVDLISFFGACEGDEISVKTFPWPKDFLHPVADSRANAACTGAQLLSLSQCTVDLLPAKYTVFSSFAPSIMHRMDFSFLAAELDNTILRDVSISDIALVLEAISAPAAGETTDYDCLEHLGVTCLKHCTELQVMAQHPNWPELYLTVERD